MAHWPVGDERPADTYAARLDTRFATCLAERTAVHGREERWPAAPFRPRRGHPVTASSTP